MGILGGGNSGSKKNENPETYDGALVACRVLSSGKWVESGNYEMSWP